MENKLYENMPSSGLKKAWYNFAKLVLEPFVVIPFVGTTNQVTVYLFTIISILSPDLTNGQVCEISFSTGS